MYGQAPGPNEGAERRPWRGRAGQTLRAWLGMDEDTFYATFYCASVTRCYPGKHSTGKGDRVPTPRGAGSVPVLAGLGARTDSPAAHRAGRGLAIGALLGRRALADCIGVRFELAADRVAIPLPIRRASRSGSTRPRTARSFVVRSR